MTDERPTKAATPTEFQVIYADCPWAYDHQKTANRKIENHYPTMSLHDIAALRVPSAQDAICYLWATAPKLQEAMIVLAAWGFTYKTNLVWDKLKIGMGYHARGQHELLLVGTKGKWHPPPPSLRPPYVIRPPRGKHSQKPEQARLIIERAYPDATRLELFARPPGNPNWHYWGNEAPDPRFVMPSCNPPEITVAPCQVCSGVGRILKMTGKSRAVFTPCTECVSD